MRIEGGRSHAEETCPKQRYLRQRKLLRQAILEWAEDKHLEHKRNNGPFPDLTRLGSGIGPKIPVAKRVALLV